MTGKYNNWELTCTSPQKCKIGDTTAILVTEGLKKGQYFIYSNYNPLSRRYFKILDILKGRERDTNIALCLAVSCIPKSNRRKAVLATRAERDC